MLSRLALQALGVGLLRTFDRPGGPLGRVLLGGRESLGDQPHRRNGAAAGGRRAHAVVICASAPKVKSVSEAIRQNAPAQTSDTIRIFKDSPADVDGSSDPSAGYKSRIRNFKPSALCCAAVTSYDFLDNAIVVLSAWLAGALPRWSNARARTSSVASSRWRTLQCKKRFGCAKKTLILC